MFDAYGIKTRARMGDDWEYYVPELETELFSDGAGERRRRRSGSGRRHKLEAKSWDQAKHEAKQTISKGNNLIIKVHKKRNRKFYTTT